MTRSTRSFCRACTRPKPGRWYLCGACWNQLPDATRAALNRRDDQAVARLRELHTHINRRLPLAEAEITP